MSALRKPAISADASFNGRVLPLPRPSARQHNHGAIALETLLKLAVNAGLSAAAVVALVNLLPYHWTQQERLSEVRTEVQQTEEHVSELRDGFSRSLDSSQTHNVMQDQTGMTLPSQQRIVFVNPPTTTP
ncbi:MAG: hypothetical protein HC838_17130 [Spirulinaceae cyanobacterium RM2_2_10]|nr:hypothetical protein [Spirulinaceae cyanobacterium SM2_1_0]NJO21409.1 hypothetical protein [Spirulinaceae cyanobacterium RM2_2_10]